MTENNYSLTMNLDSNRLQSITKVLDLFENPSAYENGTEILETIKNQLNSLTNVKKSSADTSDYEPVGW
jgi:hypothetical protein